MRRNNDKMADLSKKPTRLQNEQKLRSEAEPILEIKKAENGTQEDESKALVHQEGAPAQIANAARTNSSTNPKIILLMACAVGLVTFALLDVSNHHFNAATIRTWISAFALIGAAVSVHRATRNAFKKSANGTIYLKGEIPGKAAMPSLRTYLIMLAILACFIGVLWYAARNSM
jgi:hypothetical protein